MRRPGLTHQVLLTQNVLYASSQEQICVMVLTITLFSLSGLGCAVGVLRNVLTSLFEWSLRLHSRIITALWACLVHTLNSCLSPRGCRCTYYVSRQRTRQRCAINGTYRCHIALRADVHFAVYTFPHSFLSLILSIFQLAPTRLPLQFRRGKRKEDYLDGWMDGSPLPRNQVFFLPLHIKANLLLLCFL